MNYQEFLEYIKENILKYYIVGIEEGDDGEKPSEDDYVIELNQVLKNNGLVLDGLTIRKKDECSSPNLYLNSYFDQYQLGKPVSIIMDELICLYKQAKEESEIVVEDLYDFEAVKEHIVLRLVNYEKNKTMLKNCPHKKYLDLAITFRYMVGKNVAGIATSLISNQEFEAWDIELEDLHQIALFNTMREFPWKMESIVNVISRYVKDKAPDVLPKEMMEELDRLENAENCVNMYVLTNDSGINGATCMLYDNVIKNFAKVQDSNIFILPSSVHEVMLVPENDDVDTDFLQVLVREANESSVGLIDLMSYHVYYYDRERDAFLIYN